MKDNKTLKDTSVVYDIRIEIGNSKIFILANEIALLATILKELQVNV